MLTSLLRQKRLFISLPGDAVQFRRFRFSDLHSSKTVLRPIPALRLSNLTVYGSKQSKYLYLAEILVNVTHFVSHVQITFMEQLETCIKSCETEKYVNYKSKYKM